MLADTMTRIAAIDPHQLPDSWVLTPTNITMGEVRQLAARVSVLEADAITKEKDDLLRVATALLAKRFNAEDFDADPEFANERVCTAVHVAQNLQREVRDADLLEYDFEDVGTAE